MASTPAPDDILRDGYATIPSILDSAALDSLRSAVARLLARHEERGGVREVLGDPVVRAAATGAMRKLVLPYLGDNAFAVRGLIFDKTPSANWKVAWHQDVTIAVADYRECPGWGPWSRKEGICHVRPPVEVLNGMLTVRLHLDDCGSGNGPLRVIPGSHRAGRLTDAGISEVSRGGIPRDCLLPPGGVLLMRPLLVHASAPALAPTHRRVLHVEYAASELPDGLEWAGRWSPD